MTTALQVTGTPGGIRSFDPKTAYVPATLGVPGVEYTFGESRMHYTLPNELLGYTLPDDRLEFTIPEED